MSYRPTRADQLFASPDRIGQAGNGAPFVAGLNERDLLKIVRASPAGLLRRVGSSAASLLVNPRGALLNSIGSLLQSCMGLPLMGITLGMWGSRRAAGEDVAPAELNLGRTGATHPVEVVHRQPSQRWGWIELLRDRDPHFIQRNFHPRQVLRDAELIQAFGSATPHSGDVLLHFAGGPPKGVKEQPVPVILVHGASKNGNYWKDESKLADQMREAGFFVYAVSFAHSQDSILAQAQALSNAVDRVRQLHHNTPDLNLLGHSKGGLVVSAYAKADFRQPWMSPFPADLRRVRVMAAAAPHGGVDYSFRHPVANYVLASNSDDPRLNAPMSWTSMLTPTGMHDTSAVGFSKEGPDFFPCQREMLRRFDKEYTLPTMEQDWWTTYHGGRGFVSTSAGIDHAIEEGGHFMEHLRRAPFHPSVELCLLAGNKADVPGILNEYTGPSDGLVFVSSALDVPKDARVVAEALLPLNHKSLVSDPLGVDWIVKTFAAPPSEPLDIAERRRIEGRAV